MTPPGPLPIPLEWPAIALRLALTAASGAAIGVNRGERGKPVGLRTTMLVALAAAIAMIQVNLLLPVAGKSGDSFAVLDLMRLPLGILSGMGFIGAGAIIRRDDMVQGVTTAATLWYVTVLGLCFGGGQIGLGLAALGLALVVLWWLKRVERRMDREQHAELQVVFATETNDERQIVERQVVERLVAAHVSVTPLRVAYSQTERRCELTYHVGWRAGASAGGEPQPLRAVAELPGILHLAWRGIERD
jgi:putative Mg2+ transporter-C (MgtC) family protein